jgi:hypothetical protein
MSRQIRDIAESLGDFTATPRLLVISLFRRHVLVSVSAFVALALLKLIGLFTNHLLLPASSARR